MNLSVFGIGYVGCVSAACFAKEGHDVTGVDVNPTKVEIINSGHSPIVEPGIGELMQEAVDSGRLRATTSAAEAVSKSAVSLGLSCWIERNSAIILRATPSGAWQCNTSTTVNGKPGC